MNEKMESRILPEESIYGADLPEMERILHVLESRVEALREKYRDNDSDPVEHCLGRIKSEQSIREKCRLRGLPETKASALQDTGKRLYQACKAKRLSKSPSDRAC